MPIVASKPQSANFAPKSDMPQGLHPVVVSKVEDLGMVPVSAEILAKNRAQRQKEGGDPNSVPTSVHKARVTFSNPAGQAITKDYNLSLHEKSALYKDVLAITGNKPGDTFDLETLVGVQAQGMVVEQTSGKGTKYTKLTALIPAAPGQKVENRQTKIAAAVNQALGITDQDLGL